MLTGPNLEAQQEAVSGIEEPILTIGGDCGVEFEPIREIRKRYGAGLGVAWFDARAAVAAEQAAIERGMGITTFKPATVLRDAAHIYVHVDLDVLDSSEFDGLNMPESNGLTIHQLVSTLESLREFNVVGAGITECVGTAEQVEVLSPVIVMIGELLQPATS